MNFKLKVTSGRSQKNSFIVISLYIDVTRTTYTSLEELLVKIVEDCWNVDVEKEFSDAWTGSTRFVPLEERPPEGYTWSGRRLTRKQKSLVLTMYGQICGNLCPMQRKRKQNKDGLSRNQSSTMPDNWEEYSSLNQTTKNSSRSEKVGSSDASSNALKNTDKEQWWHSPQCWQTQDKIRLCYADESTRPRPEGAGQKTSSRSHWCRRNESKNSLQYCAQIHSDASRVKNSSCKGGSGERKGKNWRKFRRGTQQKS